MGEGYLFWKEMYLPWMGGGVPTFHGGGGIYLGWGEGVPTLDRLCCGWYASCGFPREDFLVGQVNSSSIGSREIAFESLLLVRICLKRYISEER